MVTIRYSVILLFFICLWGCSKANDTGTTLDASGLHPAGWVDPKIGGNHSVAYRVNSGACAECHGRDSTGGITGISCFSTSRNGLACHAGGPSGHPAGWAVPDGPDGHGAAAKAVFAGVKGMPHCQLCHGEDFSGGTAKKSCLNTAGCHGAGILAAHSPKPWLSKIGGRTHSSSDPTNAAACAVCHSNGTNSSRTPSPAAPPGTAPGCFNNTLCHGVEGHAFASWTSAGFHGAAAKAAEGGITVNGQNSPISSFGNCTQCHGARYDGGIAEQTCLNTAGCHGANVAAPHPARPWRSTTGGVTHTTTETGNAGQCAVCHTNGSNSTRTPLEGDIAGLTGCFNNTLCHGAGGHPAGWKAFDQHGAAAKLIPDTKTGFSSCQNCHGSTFNNGSAPKCLNTLGCHGLLVSSPHPEKPWTSTVAGALTHTTTDQANAVTCAICHTGGANSRVVPPSPATGTAGCFNNTLCHFHRIPFKPPGVDPSVHGTQFAKPDLTVCQNCHGVKGTTSFDGLPLGNVTTIACSSCHTFAKAHPTAWQGSTTNPGETVIYSHRTAGNRANACSLCHDVSQGRTAPLATAPSCFSTNFTNGLNQTGTCHASGPGVAPHTVPYPNHNATARSNFDYCLGCHQVAADVTTPSGKVIPRCQTCHLSSPVATPTGCTSCHAKPPSGTIPPVTTYPNLAAVHASHAGLNVTENLTLTAVCDQCHNGLGFGTLDHLNRARARAASVRPSPVVFGSLATTGGLVPTYTDATQNCATTYCHGSSLASNISTPQPELISSPAWNTPFPAGTHCNRCHGYPPASTGHGSNPLPDQCFNCHPHVNAAGDGFNDPTLHINGIINVNAGVAPHLVPNYNHQAAGAGASCINAVCHALGTATSVYPATVLGNAPDCRGCHKKAAPGTGAGCGSCHGAANGKPTGSTFPDRLGFHGGSQNSAHNNTTCTICHAGGGTGTGVNHGPGNRNSNPNLVGPMVNGITPTNGAKGASNSPVTCVHGTIRSGCSSRTETGW